LCQPLPQSDLPPDGFLPAGPMSSPDGPRPTDVALPLILPAYPHTIPIPPIPIPPISIPPIPIPPISDFSLMVRGPLMGAWRLICPLMGPSLWHVLHRDGPAQVHPLWQRPSPRFYFSPRPKNCGTSPPPVLPQPLPQSDLPPDGFLPVSPMSLPNGPRPTRGLAPSLARLPLAIPIPPIPIPPISIPPIPIPPVSDFSLIVPGP